MRKTTVVLALVAFACGAYGLFSVIPVGVNAEEVRDEIETIRAGSPDATLDEAVAQAVAYLTAEQSRRVRFLFMGYLVIWAALGAYVVSVARRQGRIEAEIARLKDGG
ncbi:MAG: CcmD family protein [Candidatus Poribacteria bacterium]